MTKTWLIRRAVRSPVCPRSPRASARRCAGCPSSGARPWPRGSTRRLWPQPPRCAARRRSRSGRYRDRAARATRSDLGGRADQNRNDDARFGRFDRRHATTSRRTDGPRPWWRGGPPWPARSAARIWCGGAANGPIAAMVPISLSLSAAMITPPLPRSASTAGAALRGLCLTVSGPGERGSQHGPADAEQAGDLRQPLAVLGGQRRRARSSTSRMRSKACARVSASAGSIAGIAASAASSSISSMKNCSRTSALNADEAHVCAWASRMRRTASKPRSSTAARVMPT